jgi:phosphatidylserine/phosphatidylglycerophosphate/cardiolipin synthase-like enzyme
MTEIIRATAFSNNEVAYIAWEIDGPSIPGCLGFNIVREFLNPADEVIEAKPLAAYVAFKGQHNPDGLAQNTTVWPIQKFNWRDLTLRKRRSALERREKALRVRYCIRAVGHFRDGLETVEVVPESHFDRKTKQQVHHTYEGTPIKLGYLTPPFRTNAMDVPADRKPFTSTFTNGILSTQFIVRILEEDGEITPGELEGRLKKSGDFLRNYLAGEVLPLIEGFFSQPGGRFHAALYELEDEQLEGFLATHAERLDLILSDAGSSSGDDEDEGVASNKKTAKSATAKKAAAKKAKKVVLYDTRNAAARGRLQKLAKKPGTSFKLQNRMFNGSGHIGHNKFIVYADDDGVAKSVLTGSTNWTWSGVAGQSNNCIRIDDETVAAAYLGYWTRLHADALDVPKPLSAKASGANQGDELKTENRNVSTGRLVGGATFECWFSPNMPGKAQPPSKTVKHPPPPPPDMDRLFSLMRQARKAIFFLVFMPSRGGASSIVSEAVELGLKDTSLNVVGAISDTQAMWGYEASRKTESGAKIPASSPHVFQQGGISVVRATALTDKEIGRELGDFRLAEKLTVGRAIIHDKILVLDPLDPENCVVAFGSHNLGYKASYSNDENLTIVRGHRALAEAYAVHVLDVYDHYRFRAVEAEVNAGKKRGKGKTESGKERAGWVGFLDTTDTWQQKSSHRLSKYFTA